MATKIDTNNFDEHINSGKLVVVDFYADWCGPCKIMTPIIEELSEEFESRAIIGKLDIEVEVEVANAYGVRSIPTILFFKDGEIVDKTVGATSKIQLEEMINNHI